MTWQNCYQIALVRGLLDHCPILLSVDDENWGPKPFRMLKSWATLPGYHEFVKDKWQSFQVNGWGGFVLKEKLKLLKGCLKEWHEQHGRNMVSKLKDVKERRLALEVKGEVEDLIDSEREELLFLSLHVFSLSRMQCRNQLQ
jgi:hypothetical protein